jgi:hypothetical protein
LPESRNDFGALLLPKERANLLNVKRRHAAVKHSVTVWAHRPQVRGWIDCVCLANLGQWAKVMDVDIPLGHMPIHGSEAEPAHGATCAVGRDALAARLRVALVGVDRDPPDRAFDAQRRLGDFLWQKRLPSLVG